MTRILVADDEEDLLWAVSRSLLKEGYQVLTAANGTAALALVRTQRPDLVVLDIIMPGIDGLRLCQELHQDPLLSGILILLLTSRSRMEERVEGLDYGADDYLTKPFDLAELKARLRALLRRRPRAPSVADSGCAEALQAGELTLFPRSRQVQVGEEVVQLTPSEFSLLHFLVTHPQQIFGSGHLLRQALGYSAETADPGLVRLHMKNLRQKVEPDPAHPTRIRTIPHQGYLFAP